jgi:hypothetical protein
MEYWVDSPLRGERQLVRHWGDHLYNLEGPMSSRRKLD